MAPLARLALDARNLGDDRMRGPECPEDQRIRSGRERRLNECL